MQSRAARGIGGIGGIDGLTNRRVGVWGTGREGRAIARLALDRGASVTVFEDEHPTSGHADDGRLEEVVAGTTPLSVSDPSSIASSSLEVLVRSPGVSRYRPELDRLRARGIPVTTATAIWLEDFAGHRVIGVTGSKGKSTTASLAAMALESDGTSVGLGGNIGTPVTDFYEAPSRDVYVIEVSSFQAAEVTASPPVGVLTLLVPDHLDWHGDFEAYVADKLNLFAHRRDLGLAVNARCQEALSRTAEFPNRHLYGADGEVRVVGDASDAIAIAGEVYTIANDAGSVSSRLRGRHNLDNLCGAITAVGLLTGVTPDPGRLVAAISSMSSLPSRLETVAVGVGIEFVDDALASNPAGTIAALGAFTGRPVSLIAGGFDRGTDLGDLARAIVAHGDVSLVLLTNGNAARRLERELEQALRAERCDVPRVTAGSVSDAVGLAVRSLDVSHGGSPTEATRAHGEAASSVDDGSGATCAGRQIAGTGVGVVLFSPAAPTPPSEGTYVERSAEFKRAVLRYLDSTAREQESGTVRARLQP